MTKALFIGAMILLIIIALLGVAINYSAATLPDDEPLPVATNDKPKESEDA